MRRRVTALTLSRETIRELSKRDMRSVAGGANLSVQNCNLTIPPTFCACTGTETRDICYAA